MAMGGHLSCRAVLPAQRAFMAGKYRFPEQGVTLRSLLGQSESRCGARGVSRARQSMVVPALGARLAVTRCTPGKIVTAWLTIGPACLCANPAGPRDRPVRYRPTTAPAGGEPEDEPIVGGVTL